MENLEIDRDYKNYRLWEILPGLLAWSAFVLPIILSLFAPVLVASLIIIYAFYWLVKSFLMSVHLIMGYKMYKRDININWLKRCQKFANWQDIYHLIFLATYKEDAATLRESIKALSESHYPLDKIILVIAGEERDRDKALNNIKILEKEFSRKFYQFAYTIHPQDIKGEVKGKGSNISYSARQILKLINDKKIPHQNILVTTLDADNRVHKEYLPALTYHYLSDPDSIHSAYQPIAMYLNNIWDVPLIIRSVSIGSSFWQMIESTRPYRLRNFSAHAQSLPSLIKTDFWSVKSIVEDGHQYWRSLLAFSGNYRVIPLNIPVYQDAVLSPKGYYATFREQYLQKRRWAWGCSDIPYVISKILFNKKINLYQRWIQFFRLLEGHFSWATTSMILAIIGWMPRLINTDFQQTVMAYNFPWIYSRILTIAMLGMIVTMIISLSILSPIPKGVLTKKIIIEWILSPIILPLSNIILSSLPAIESQTRLMLGKYLDFRVTEKAASDNHD